MPYIDGQSRDQLLLLPDAIEDYVGEENVVRAIDAFIVYLRFDELGFIRSEAAERGRPGYDPRDLLGIYIWGHFNGVRSSRRLERECGRNLELMWLTGKLRPDFKTLCRFRQENGNAIKSVLAEFRVWANREGLFGKELVAIDGSKFKAVNSKARSYTPEKLERMIEREREKVERYMADLEEADNEDGGDEEKQLSGKELREKIARMKKYLERHKMVLKGMKERGEKQHSETDPDARMMKTTKGSEVSYNVQIAVDEKHKLIVDVEATNEIADQGLLAQMAVKAKEVLEVEHLVVVADGGYFSNEAIRECEESGITSFVPVPKLGNARHKGIFPREVFSYDESRDTYLCPAGEEMTVVSRTSAKGRYTKDYKVYGTSKCQGCPLRQQCTTSKHGRKIKRWVHYKVFERLQARIRNQPEMLRKRKGIVEHPFGTIKVSMNHERLLTKGLSNVGTEMAFAAISYNLRRVLSVLGIKMMMQRFQHELARK